MSEANSQGRQWTGLAVLALALVVAAAAGAFLLLSGGGEEKSSPERAVRAMYDAINEGDTTAFEAALAPDVRDAGAAALVPFPATLGAYEAVDAEGHAKVSTLSMQSLGEQESWALIGVKGTLDFEGSQREFTETAYVRRVGERWLVSNQQAFLGQSENGATSTAPAQAGLGPLVPERPEIGQPAPDFALIDARDGTTVRKLSDFRGTPLVVNWYASWCGPCKEEIPEFQQAQVTLGDEVLFIGVNAKEDLARAQGILDLFGATYPAVLDSDGSVAQHYRVSVLPYTVFIDADGVLRAIKVGQVHADDLEENLAKIGLTYQAD